MAEVYVRHHRDGEGRSAAVPARRTPSSGRRWRLRGGGSPRWRPRPRWPRPSSPPPDGLIAAGAGRASSGAGPARPRTELMRRNPDSRAARDRAAAGGGRRPPGSVDAASANKATQETRIASAAAGAEGERRGRARAGSGRARQDPGPAGFYGMLQQFTLRLGEVVNPIIRTGGILVPVEQRVGLIAGFGQIEAQVMKVGMIAEATCIASPSPCCRWWCRRCRT